MSNTQKFNDFITSTMVDKDVSSVPGIGTAFEDELRAQNVRKV